MRLIHGAASDVGLVRTQNEDSYLVGPGVFAVCDGMGGALAGEVASETACRHLMQLHPETDSADKLVDAVRRANAEIFARSLGEPALAGMGTTLTAAMRQGDTLVFAHVGDSRAYLLRAGRLQQLTEDHSLVAELVRQGRITPQEAAVHPHRSVITRALGTEQEVPPDLVSVPLQVGDRIVICSDGVSGLVPDEQIGQVLAAVPDPEAAARSLVAEAIARGGDDNATAVVVFVVDNDDQTVEPAQDMCFGPQRRDERLSAGGYRGAAVRAAEAVRGRLRRLRSRRVWARRARPPRKVMGAVVVVAILLIAVVGFAVFNSSVYHVGTSGDAVVLYRGLPLTVLGVRLFTPVEQANVPYSHLKPYERERVDSHELRTQEEGRQFLRSLESAS